MKPALSAVIAATLLVSCGGGIDDGAAPEPTPTTDATPASPDPGTEYEATGFVLQAAPDADPKLCLGGVMESYPPQCGDIPIANWDWNDVPGEERASGVTWGDYTLVGNFDGDVFTMTRPPKRAVHPEPPPEEPIETPCDAPPGGWQTTDSSTTSDPSFEATMAAARREPDFAGAWIEYLDPYRPDSDSDPQYPIITAAFTGDLDRHERDLRALWDGPLCVWHHDRSLHELEQIQQDLTENAGDDFGLDVLYSNASETDNIVELGVVWIDRATKNAIDDRYGRGIVEVTPALRPVTR